SSDAPSRPSWMELDEEEPADADVYRLGPSEPAEDDELSWASGGDPFDADAVGPTSPGDDAPHAAAESVPVPESPGEDAPLWHEPASFGSDDEQQPSTPAW